jgi:hypothetical protein
MIIVPQSNPRVNYPRWINQSLHKNESFAWQAQFILIKSRKGREVGVVEADKYSFYYPDCEESQVDFSKKDTHGLSPPHSI